MSTQVAPVANNVIEFKSTSLVTPVLVLSGNNLAEIDQQLSAKVAQAPEFFKHSPLIVDFHKLDSVVEPLAVEDIMALVKQHGFMPIGIRGGNEQHNTQAWAMNLPVHSMHSQTAPLVPKKHEEPVAAKATAVSETADAAGGVVENKLINHPIRSGQRVYVKGDLIVTASVSAGAEIMAEGNIHVYGSLRGRALAGVLGNVESRIFCADLQAELVSIAGIYKLKDDLMSYPQQTSVQIALEGDSLHIKPV